MFWEIYGAQLKELGTHAFHVMEELAEVDKELQSREFVGCQQEVADVVSWVLSLGSRVGRLLNKTLSIQDQLAIICESY